MSPEPARSVAAAGPGDGWAQLESALDRARDGSATTLVVRGEPGIGKSTLLDALSNRATDDDFTVLATRGTAADAEVGFASLLTLLRPVAQELDVLANDLAPDVQAALTLGTTDAADSVRVRLGVYRLVTGLAERSPVLVAVDDAHLLDAATAEVLAFVAGRLAADRVAIVLAVDGALPGSLDGLTHDTVVLNGLPPDQLAELVRADGPIAEEPLERCCALAGGNPLVALELARSLDHDERTGAAPMPRVPRPPEVLARGFVSQLAALSPTARLALVVASADDTGEARVVRGALARLGEPAAALDETELAGLIRLDGGMLRLAHPLLRAVAYHQVASGSRRAAHRALAAELDRPDDAVARAWQLAAAADGPDRQAADALELVAVDVARRGGTGSAARVLERSAALTPDAAERAARWVAAADAWLAAFDPALARAALARADDLGPGEADDDLLLGAVEVERRAAGPLVALERVRAAQDAHGEAANGRGQLAKALEADLLLDAGSATEAASRAASVLAAAPERGAGPAGAMAKGVLARVGGAPPTGGDRVEGMLAEAAHRRDAGDVVGAYEQLGQLDALVPPNASLLRVPVELALADCEWLLGRGDDARARLEPTRSVAHEHGLASAVALAAWLAGRDGLDRTAAPGPTADPARFEPALASLTDAARQWPARFGAELVVALLAAGRPREAQRWLDQLEPTRDLSPRFEARRARAAAAWRGDRELLDRAAAVADDAGLPVEAAETRLAHAEHLGRAGRVDDARGLAERARDDLASRGIRAWSGRLGHLLHATDAPAGVEADLTRAEYRVALAVAGGGTNREVATKLFLSVKTVDFHLQNIYRKLGLRSRTELALRLSRDLARHPSGGEEP